MWFWWFMLICDLIIPIAMVIGGRMMWKHCPKNINSMSGYRTTRSMKNMDTVSYTHLVLNAKATERPVIINGAACVISLPTPLGAR